MRAPRLLSILVCSIFGACTDDGVEHHAVWSDDGARIGLIARTYEETQNLWNTSRTYLRWRVLEQDPATGAREELGPEVDGAAEAMPLFDMRRAGYFLVRTSGNLRVVQVLRDRTVREVGAIEGAPETCPTLDVIPSPDGARLARVRTQSPGCTTHTSSSSTTVDVELLDAITLAPVAPTARVVLGGWPSATWTPSGKLVVAATLGVDPCIRAYAIVDGEAVPTEPPGCMAPPTTSSNVRADGELVQVVGDDQVTLVRGATTAAFGCQTRPAAFPSCDAI
ncbi:hypothetical protein L6R52_35705 [Myxococcota bacterium]|nr:hypothetical protein [Myxococcota bacterium]